MRRLVNRRSRPNRADSQHEWSELARGAQSPGGTFAVGRARRQIDGPAAAGATAITLRLVDARLTRDTPDEGGDLVEGHQSVGSVGIVEHPDVRHVAVDEEFCTDASVPC